MIKVRTRKDENPQFARIIIAGEWLGDPDDAESILRISLSQINAEDLFTVTTCRGFIVLHWEEVDLDPNEIKKENWEEVEVVVEDWVRQNLEDVLREFEKVAYNVTFGLDLMKEWVKCEGKVTPGKLYEGKHMELVVVYETGSGEIHITGKSYPTDQQKRDLIPAPLDTHFMELSWKEQEISTLVLGCHDLNVFNPRAWKKAKGYKRKAIDYIINRSREEAVEAVIHHPHMTDTYSTWRSAIIGMRRVLGDVLFISAGRWARPCGMKPRMDLYTVLKKMKIGRSYDVIFFV